MADKIRKDLLCENCAQKEATHLLYFKRYYKESGHFALINPQIICDDCSKLFKTSNLFFENQPVLIPFETIGKVWDWRLGGLLSKGKWEFNVFYKNKYWYSKLKRIRIIWSKPRKDLSSQV